MSARGFDVSLDNVHKTFSGASGTAHVLGGITATVMPGEFLVMCGRSGAGKSTLLRLMAGLDRPTSGSITIEGRSFDRPVDGLAYIVQDYSRSLFPWLKVKTNVGLGLASTGLGKAEKEGAIAAGLRAVGLDGYGESFPWQLSGGMQQRVALARALVAGPRLLLMDEPFASVDAHVRLELEDLTSQLVRERGITTVFVTHDIDEAVYLADRIWVLSQTPARITHEFRPGLGHQRDQVSTRALPDFLETRARLFDALRPGFEGQP